MSTVRHYKVTTTYGRGTSRTVYRTVQSRGYFWGPYSTPKERKEAFVVALLIVLFGWPWALQIPLFWKIAIGVVWDGLCLLLSVAAIQSRARQ